MNILSSFSFQEFNKLSHDNENVNVQLKKSNHLLSERERILDVSTFYLFICLLVFDYSGIPFHFCSITLQ